METCSVDGCEEKVKSKGYCKQHYYRFRYYGDPLGVSKHKTNLGKLCARQGCKKKAVSNNLCTNHDMMRKYIEYRQKGLCYQCGVHTGTTKVYCIDCSAQRSAYKKAQRWKMEGE